MSNIPSDLYKKGGPSSETLDPRQLECSEDGSELDEHDEEQRDYVDLTPQVDSIRVAKVREMVNEDGTLRKIFRARKSDWVGTVIHLNGEKFDFAGRDYLRPIYDRPDRQLLLKTARQVEKTTFLGNNLTINSVVRPYNKALYVSPSHTQTRQFSNEKLRPAIDGSPMVKKYFQDSGVSTQVFEKGFTNGSYIFLRSAFRSADRTRGISARELCLDEIQDMLISEIPVIMECTSHFPDAQVLMAGTPKSLDNPIEVYWQETTQNEWLVPCRSCNTWNFLDEQNIAPTEMYTSQKLPPGPVCKKCIKPIDVTKGQWMSLSPGKQISGYRIPQLMVPWINSIYSQWLKLLWKRDNYPLGQFLNEVLGISYDNASKPITRAELIALCQPYDMIPNNPSPQQLQQLKSQILCAGVDWGEGNDGTEKSPSGKIKTASYTVLTIGTYVNQKQWKIVFAKKYTGKETDPEFVVNDIARIVHNFGIRLIGVDWGHGWGVNNQLVRKLGPERVVQFQYIPKIKQRVKWDPIGFKYMLHRNMAVSELFYALKQGNIVFPKWAQMEPFAKDILGIYTEYDEYRREMKFDHRASDPDDFFHSMNYAKLANDICVGKKPGGGT